MILLQVVLVLLVGEQPEQLHNSSFDNNSTKYKISS